MCKTATTLVFSVALATISNTAMAQLTNCPPSQNQYYCENRNWVYSRLSELGASNPDAVRFLLKRAQCQLDPASPLLDQIHSCEQQAGIRFVCALTRILVDDAKMDRTSFYDNCMR
jgi:hypothetical protein